jgi:hypothetical protein
MERERSSAANGNASAFSNFLPDVAAKLMKMVTIRRWIANFRPRNEGLLQGSPLTDTRCCTDTHRVEPQFVRKSAMGDAIFRQEVIEAFYRKGRCHDPAVAPPRDHAVSATVCTERLPEQVFCFRCRSLSAVPHRHTPPSPTWGRRPLRQRIIPSLSANNLRAASR